MDVFLGGPDEDLYRDALRLSPTNGFVLLRAAEVFSALGDKLRADALFRAGVSYGSRRASPGIRYADWLIGEGRHREAVEIVGAGVMLESERLLEYVAMLESNGLEGPEVLGAMPEKPGPRILLAKYFQRQGNDLLAEDAYRNAFGLLGVAGSLDKLYYMRLLDYFFKKGEYDSALAVLRYAVEEHPADPDFRIRLGLLYEKMGITYRAEQEYEKALMLEPGNERALKRLKKLRAGR
jgi:Tfp pilus assembly protein PilF